MTNKMKARTVNLKNCDSIGEMVDYTVELNVLYEDITNYLDFNLDNLKTSYKYFNEHKYNRCYSKLEELKRDIQIVRRKTDILDDKIFDSTLPDSAMCFLFDKNLKEINREILKLNEKSNDILEKITFKFFLIQN